MSTPDLIWSLFEASGSIALYLFYRMVVDEPEQVEYQQVR